MALAVSACAPAERASTVMAPAVSDPWRVAVAPRPAVKPSATVVQVFTGEASWYGSRFDGRTTASGEPFDMDDLTAAHRTLPFGTRVRVTNEANGRSVIVRVNDRGPFAGARIIDLSRKAAETIGLKARGVGRVRLEVLERTSPNDDA